MPEYLSPGVYVEEVSFRARSIEALSTTTTAFIGPTRYGPTDLPLDVITSIGEFERTYGDRQQMQFQGSSPTHNYMWHAARAFFENGGTRLYVSRVFTPLATVSANNNADGRATDPISGAGATMLVTARFPGDAGNMHVRITLQKGPNILAQDTVTSPPQARGLLDFDIVALHNSLSSPPSTVFALAESYFDTQLNQPSWQFWTVLPPSSSVTPLKLKDMHPNADPNFGDKIWVITATVTIYPNDPNLSTWVYSGLALDRNHQLNGKADSIEAQFALSPIPDNLKSSTTLVLNSLGEARTVPIVITMSSAADNGLAVLNALLNSPEGLRATASPPEPNLQTDLLDSTSTDVARSIDIVLKGGNDGQRPPGPGELGYEGLADPASTKKTGLKAFEDIDEISIVAAPGSTFDYEGGYRDDASTIISLLIAHAEQMRYRIAVLDSGDGEAISDVRALRARFDSTYAALYYPWVTILDPVTRKEINLPPSGFVTGIYARNDINRAVYKAPANEVVNLALTFESVLNKAQQDVLNPIGVNCFRFFEDRGYRLWGARTISSDPEWKYVNMRRYFAYLEHSIDKGTQWAVFEPNGPILWASLKRTVSDFLLNEFQNGALLGDKPEQAYFVRCDRSTMTQNDLDNGRVIVLVGVAALTPAEFVIFRIGQWTANS
jgi:phage tail sheath protein FI